MTAMRLLAVLAVLLVSAAGCAVETAETGSDEQALELGTGSWRFEPLEDGQEVELVRGAQGGWHVWVSLRATGMQEDRPALALEIQPADESLPPARTEVDVLLGRPDSDGRRSLLGWPAVIPDPSCLVGEMIRIEAELGESLSAERHVIPTGGAYPPPPCDE